MAYSKLLFPFSLLVILSCNSGDTGKTDKDSTVIETPIIDTPEKKTDTVANPRVYSNTRFQNVVVTRESGNVFRVKGKGQIFEASFGWVIEDGHNELKEGYTTTDAGAPEWGNFDFTVEAVKARPNSTLMLILFETSAKDGSRQHELPIFLY